jgi:nucleoid-associated protein YgaU
MTAPSTPPGGGMPDFSDVKSGASSTAPAAAPAYTMYTIKSGDSLSKIAKKHYGNANDWRKIYEANRDLIKDPDKIFPGQEIKIPV